MEGVGEYAWILLYIDTWCRKRCAFDSSHERTEQKILEDFEHSKLKFGQRSLDEHSKKRAKNLFVLAWGRFRPPSRPLEVKQAGAVESVVNNETDDKMEVLKT